MKVKNIVKFYASILTCCTIPAWTMECEEPAQIQQAQPMPRQKLYFSEKTGRQIETKGGMNYANFPIKLSKGETVKISFLTSLDEALVRDTKEANTMLQPPCDRLVANLACAHIRDEAITNWYMQMFSLSGNSETDKDAHISTLKWSDEHMLHLASPIINFEDGMTDEQKGLFIDSFKKIASTPIGRVLLYRILVEVSRCYEEGNNLKWTDVNFCNGNDDIYNRRECCRFIYITLAHPTFMYYQNDDQILRININDYNFYGCTYGGCTHNIATYSTDVSLFKKLTTWYHTLRNLEETAQLCSTFPVSLYGKNTGTICEQYEINKGDDLNVWWYKDLESIRSILGDVNHNYGQGISENAYNLYKTYEESLISGKKLYFYNIHWGDYYNATIRINPQSVQLAMKNAATCVFNITGIKLPPFNF